MVLTFSYLFVSIYYLPLTNKLYIEIHENVVRREVFDFKNKESQKMFFEATNLSTKFSGIFDQKGPIENNVNKFYKTLDDTFHQCFKKIRIKSKNSVPNDEEEKNILKKMNLKKEF